MPSRIVVVSLVLTLQSTAAAQSPHEQPERCLMPASVEDTVRERSESHLRQLYLRCAFVSEQRRLDDNEMVACAVAADTLLKRGFAGDFDAMLAWLREHLDGLRATAAAGGAKSSVGASR